MNNYLVRNTGHIFNPQINIKVLEIPDSDRLTTLFKNCVSENVYTRTKTLNTNKRFI